MTCAHHDDVERHFAASLSVDEEHAFREHLAGCAACKSHYEARLALNRLLPSAPSAQARLAHGLGLAFEPEAKAARAPRVTWALAAVAVSAVVGVAAWQLVASPPSDDEYAPRGAKPTAALEVYRVRPGAAPERNPHQVKAGDELAFAYRNPNNAKWLMVYAVDAAGNVAWYYPEWKAGAAAPSPVSAEPGAVLHELPSAIALPLSPGRVTLHLVLLEHPLSTADVEQRLADKKPVSQTAAEADVPVSLEVTP